MKAIKGILGRHILGCVLTLALTANLQAQIIFPPIPGGGGGGCTNCPPILPNTNRNYVKYQDHVFTLMDTNQTAATATNLFAALLAFPESTNAEPHLQVLLYGTDTLLIKANHFDYSAETERDFALLVCDKAETPVWKAIDFLGAADSQDGWLVQGTVPNWKVTDPMYFQITGIARDCNAFFRAIPYRGAEISFISPQPYDVVSNTISLAVAIQDLSGITNELFEVTVDGLPARYSLGTNNTVTLNTKYNPEGPVNVYLRTVCRALVCNLTNKPADAKISFESLAALPLDFENDTYLLFGSDYASPDIGTNYFYFVTDKPQTITASIIDPTSGQTLVAFGGYVPYAATIVLDWDFTEADGVTPYTNSTYAVHFQTSNPTTLDFTNRIDRNGVRTAAGCYLTYQEEDPFDPGYGLTSLLLNERAETWVKQTLKQLYRDLYKSLSLTQYTTSQVGSGRNHSDCVSLGPDNLEWAAFLRPALSNANYSEFTVAQAHGNGFTVGGGPFLLNKFNTYELQSWLQSYPNPNWRLRRAAFWTCYSGVTPHETGDFSFAQACGIRPPAQQEYSYMQKNCGLFFGGALPQAWVTENELVVTAQAAQFLEQAWVCGKNQWPGACDPTYSFQWAVAATLGKYPEMNVNGSAEPRVFGCLKMIYSSVYDDELMRLDWSHVKEN